MLGFPPSCFGIREDKLSPQGITAVCGLGVEMGHRSAWMQRELIGCPSTKWSSTRVGKKYGILHSA